MSDPVDEVEASHPPGAAGRGAATEDDRRTIRGLVAVIATGIFVTGFGWPGMIGRLPFSLLLKNRLGRPAQDVATFWAVATIAWYGKPVIALLCDAVPLFGTKRRGYMLLGTVAAAVFWLAFAIVPARYGWLMALMTALNLAMVVVSAAVGGLQVEVSQRYGATGRLASLRQGLEGFMSLAAGPVGGFLALRAFGWTALGGAAILLSFLPFVLWYRERVTAGVDRGALARASARARRLGRSRGMWAAAGLLFLVYLAPGFYTAMLYYQTDVLHFNPRLIGTLQLLGGLGSTVGSAAYGAFCRRLRLRTLLIGGIILNAATTLVYLRYDSARAAMLIDTGAGMLQAIAILPLYDLAARATPKGSESFGFALMISIRDIAIFAISDVAGSYLYGHYHIGFRPLVWINAAATLAVLLFVPMVPAALLAGREGDPRANAS